MKKRNLSSISLVVTSLMIIFFLFVFYFASKIVIPDFPNNDIIMFVIAIFVYLAFILLILRKRKNE